MTEEAAENEANHILDRLTQRLGEPTTAEAFAVRRWLHQVCGALFQVEWNATHVSPIEPDVAVEAAELRRETEQGAWDHDIEHVREATGALRGKLIEWRGLHPSTRDQIADIRAVRDQHRAVEGKSFLSFKARVARLVKAGQWRSGTAGPAIQRAVEAADRYGVRVRGEPWGPRRYQQKTTLVRGGRR